MKAVGEVMAIGRTFPEALQKGVRSLDIGMDGFGSQVDRDLTPDALSVPTAQRLFQVASLIASGLPFEEIITQTHFDPWFVEQMRDLMDIHRSVVGKALRLHDLDEPDLRKLKQYGFSDAYIADLMGEDRFAVRDYRKALASAPIFIGLTLALLSLRR